MMARSDFDKLPQSEKQKILLGLAVAKVVFQRSTIAALVIEQTGNTPPTPTTSMKESE